MLISAGGCGIRSLSVGRLRLSAFYLVAFFFFFCLLFVGCSGGWCRSAVARRRGARGRRATEAAPSLAIGRLPEAASRARPGWCRARSNLPDLGGNVTSGRGSHGEPADRHADGSALREWSWSACRLARHCSHPGRGAQIRGLGEQCRASRGFSCSYFMRAKAAGIGFRNRQFQVPSASSWRLPRGTRADNRERFANRPQSLLF